MSNIMVLFTAQVFPLLRLDRKTRDAWKKWNSKEELVMVEQLNHVHKENIYYIFRSTRPRPPRKNVSQNPFSYDYGTSYSTTEKGSDFNKAKRYGVNTTCQSSRLRLQRKSQSFLQLNLLKRKQRQSQLSLTCPTRRT